MGSKPWRSPKVRRGRAEVERFIDLLRREMPDVEWTVGGSWRRGDETVGDLDVLVIAEEGPLRALEGRLPLSFTPQLGSGRVERGVVIQGDLTLDGEAMHLDFWFGTPDQRGAFLWFITGPKALNVAMRAHAGSNGMVLSQYGVFSMRSGRKLDDGSERGVAEVVGWPWIDPEDRTAWKDLDIKVDWPSAKEQEERVFVVPGSKGSRYEVRVSEDGSATCTCKGFMYRRACRHVKQVKEAMR